MVEKGDFIRFLGRKKVRTHLDEELMYSLQKTPGIEGLLFETPPNKFNKNSTVYHQIQERLEKVSIAGEDVNKYLDEVKEYLKEFHLKYKNE